MSLFLILVISALVIVVIHIGFNLCVMWRDPSWFLFPAITECSLCEKRVYVWQRREHRSWQIPVLGDAGRCRATMSGIVHKGCCGEPKATITRTMVTKPADQALWLASSCSNPAGPL